MPDGDPEVLLSGFGMEDAHSVANSLTWGPDGWLYGCQGSTVTANIRGIEFQQGVWRYHPLTHRFELFCEGGGNSWGLDFDRHGELLYSTNFGGHVMLHGEQGAYLWKSFGKHGALHNAHAYGYFEHVPHAGFKGGHVTVGGIVYQGDTFPERFRGKYIAADLLGHNVYWHDVEEDGSTFRTKHGGELLLSNDTWFAPSDVTLGPDGAVYVADWFDRRTAHPDPDAEWDRSNGRIYRIAAKGTPLPKLRDLTKLGRDDLVKLLSHPSQWYVRKARRILADRRDTELTFPMRTRVLEGRDDQDALESLWTLDVCGGFTEGFALKALEQRSPHVRRWTVRLLGDDNRVSAEVARRLAEMAATEPDVRVRAQLACTARRLPAGDGLPVIEALLRQDRDGKDLYVPLLVWWAVEQHSLTALTSVAERFSSPWAWQSAVAREVVLPRLVRRYASEPGEAPADACVRLVESAPGVAQRNDLLMALEQGWRERPGGLRSDDVPIGLRQRFAGWAREQPDDLVLLRLQARLREATALQRAVQLATDPKTPAAARLSLLELLAEVADPGCVAVVGKLLGGAESDAVQMAAVGVLRRFDAEDATAVLLDAYPRLKGRVKDSCAEALLSRSRSARAFLQRIDRGDWPAKDVAADLLRPLAAFKDKDIDALVRKHWGNVTGGTPEEKLAEVRRLNNDLRAGTGDAVAGKLLFAKHCASCHKLFGEGGSIGPDLTHANRKDRDYLLVSIVDPSAVVRKEFLSYVVTTTDGRTLSGLIAAQDGNRVTLLTSRDERITLNRDQIDSLDESPVSLMPENLLKELKPQELRDLFSYLQREGP